jgi:hypothetical protein
MFLSLLVLLLLCCFFDFDLSFFFYILFSTNVKNSMADHPPSAHRTHSTPCYYDPPEPVFLPLSVALALHDRFDQQELPSSPGQSSFIKNGSSAFTYTAAPEPLTPIMKPPAVKKYVAPRKRTAATTLNNLTDPQEENHSQATTRTPQSRVMAQKSTSNHVGLVPVSTAKATIVTVDHIAAANTYGEMQQLQQRLQKEIEAATEAIAHVDASIEKNSREDVNDETAKWKAVARAAVCELMSFASVSARKVMLALRVDPAMIDYPIDEEDEEEDAGNENNVMEANKDASAFSSGWGYDTVQ